MASPPIRPLQQPALNVTPLNSMPYIDPITPLDDELNNSPQPQGDVETREPERPMMLYLPRPANEEQQNQLLAIMPDGVFLSGSSAIGSTGPVLGKMDMSESKDTYLFRVSLPGVARDEFTCDVAPDGKIMIKGVTTTGEKVVYKNSMKFEMLSQNLAPPGHFYISFMLPGPVESQDLTGHFGIDGIFEGIVKKKISPA